MSLEAAVTWYNFLGFFHDAEKVDAYIASERAKHEAIAVERERVLSEQWRVAVQTGTLDQLLPPDEL